MLAITRVNGGSDSSTVLTAVLRVMSVNGSAEEQKQLIVVLRD